MLKNDVEYRETVKMQYNEKIKECLKSLWSFQVWKEAFAAGFNAARSHEENERLKGKSLEKYNLEVENI